MRLLDRALDRIEALPRPVCFWIVVVAVILGWIMIGSLLVGCATWIRTPPPGPFAAAPVRTAEEAFTAPLGMRLMALTVGAEPTAGNVRSLPVRSACRPRTGVPLPYILTEHRAPQAGVEWRCRFVTSVLGPEPDQDLWIVLSTEPPGPGLPVDLAPIGMPGCSLSVNPQTLISVPRGFPADESQMLSRTPGRGRVLLRWTPPAGTGGFKVWLQCMTASPGEVPAGFLLSHGLELTVGS